MSWRLLIISIVLSFLLFLYKHGLPLLTENDSSKQKRKKTQALIELLHFPNDLLMIAAGCTLPIIVQNFHKLNNSMSPDVFIELAESSYKNMIITLIIMAFVPFFVSIAKKCEKLYFQGRKKAAFFIDTLLYLVAVAIVLISFI